MEYTIETIDVSKSFGSAQVIKNVSLHIGKQRCHGLLGRNGAGKTTILRMLAGLTKPDAGKIYLSGKPVEHSAWFSSNVGIVYQYTGLPESLRIREFLVFEQKKRGISRKSVDYTLELFGLKEQSDKKIQHLSEGNKRRLVIAKGVIHSPSIILLDEPTAGVDPVTRHEIWDYLKILRQNGATLIIASHDLAEIEELCDEVSLIDRGVVIFSGDIQSLDSKNNVRILTLGFHNVETTEKAMLVDAIHGDGFEITNCQSTKLVIKGYIDNGTMMNILKAMNDQEITIHSMNYGFQTFEEIALSCLSVER
ncbi:MAG: ABC transporter ATP-binding protein [Thermoleophilia bacterium]